MASLRSGISSALLRNRPAAEGGARARSLDPEGVKWGDVHATPGDTASASQAARVTRDSGFEAVSYHPPYRLLLSRGAGKNFSDSTHRLAPLTGGVETWLRLFSQPALADIGARAVFDRISGDGDDGLKSGTRTLFSAARTRLIFKRIRHYAGAGI